ncbi:polysaccharide biosynthesis/export family protein [Tropicimonas sp. IMCC34011]|uniref:polysaccharide biosynthesis/export family protein n=1 Tax=Tropicimonas sp. IMCC34011 TaxID=2248759 RepID=UPI001E62E8BA|nr:polysaccharide biosynthesis/export family protein [Tropicimonas sp. IMCC34011]
MKRAMRPILMVAAAAALAGCGVIYNSPQVGRGFAGDDTAVRVVPITPQTVLAANRSTYQPKQLPAAFRQTAGTSAATGPGLGALPPPIFRPEDRPGELALRVPPEAQEQPYRIGVGDVLLLATPTGSSVEQLSGLLAAQNSRQGYTVQDDGAIAVPDVGRISVSGMTVPEAEDRVFQRLVEAQIDPTFSLEIAEFNSSRVSLGGAVSNPGVIPITLTPLYLEEALANAGGVTAQDVDYASVRIYRDGQIYQIPVNDLYASDQLRRIKLLKGDAIFVDDTYDLAQAQAYFEEVITRSQLQQNARTQALAELNSAVGFQRAALAEQRGNFTARQSLGAEQPDYVYLAGEVQTQSRFAMPYENDTTLADALYEQGGYSNQTGNSRQIYVLRGSADPRDFAAVTAWHLDATNAANFVLATRFELRPNDVIFVAEQPVTRWNRAISQIPPAILNPVNRAINDT